MKKITFAILLLSNFIFAQSNHTVSFSGNSSDFNVGEKIWGGDDVDYYVTFDDTYLYFGAFRVNASTFGAFDHFTFYIDSDPQSTIASGNGSTTGLSWDSNTPTLPFNADHRFAIRTNALGESFHHKYTGGSWQDQTAGNTSNFDQYATSTALEIRIPKASIDNANGIYFAMYMSYNGGFFGANDGSYPVSISGSTVSGYFGGIGINAAGCTPVSSFNTPITGTLTNTNPNPSGKYAHIDINSGDFTVTGDIEIVSGGTTSITAGNSLTVDGTLTNNGAISLGSTSTSFSNLMPNTMAGTGTTSYERYANSNSNGNDLIAPPVGGQTWASFLADGTNATDLLDDGNIGPTTYVFGPFDKASDNWLNYTDATVATLSSGTGYRVGTDAGTTLLFTGSVATSMVTVDIENTGANFPDWNLIGNPYTTYLDIADFLNYDLGDGTRNIDILEDVSGIYGYDGSASDGWDVITLANASARDMAPGQGFFVAADAAFTSGYDITFAPSMRRINSTDDFIAGRNSEALTYLKLKSSTLANDFTTQFYFNDNATVGLDHGYDAKVWGDTSASFALYSNLVEDNFGLPIALQALNTTDLTNVVIPLGVNANAGEQLTFTISETTLPTNINVYLDDTLNNTTTLLNNSDYIINPVSHISGTGRFFIRFTEQVLSNSDVDFDNLKIYTGTHPKVIYVQGVLQTDAVAKVYDLQGRLVHQSLLSRNSVTNQIDAAGFSDGIYVVTLSTDTHEKSQKIIIR